MYWTIRLATTSPSSHVCADESMYRCEGAGGVCIFESWVCDGESDCPNGDDEARCSEFHYFDYIYIILYISDATVWKF